MEAVLELSQALVEHSASHVVVIDESGRIRYVNAAWIRFSRENRGRSMTGPLRTISTSASDR
ncbi:MAG: hypothetical protein CME36_19940 [unclassified Hahellaceae]|nr:hypothetical protein [Hahellaceae bacterium]